MVPYFQQPSVTLGPLTIHAFGVVVAAAAVAGLELGRRRFRHLGLGARVGEQLMWYAVVGGFIGAHLFAVLFYFPDKVAAHPLILFKLWEDLSSFGGLLGGAVAIWIYFRLRAPHLDRATHWAYLDGVAFVFPAALAIGRLACALAHDHPGTITSFPLAISLDTEPAREFIVGVYRQAGRLSELPDATVLARLGFHDLGWYEFLYLSLVMVPVVLVVHRRHKASTPPGTFVALFTLLYMPVRFGLDFLRVSDARYAGLTPAQWVAALVLIALPIAWLRRPVLAPDASSPAP